MRYELRLDHEFRLEKPFVTSDDRRKRRWCFMDLVTDHQTGKLRETLVWSNVGKGIAAWALVHNVLKGTDTETLWLIVLGVLTAHELASRWLAQKLGVQSVIPETKPEPAKT